MQPLVSTNISLQTTLASLNVKCILQYYISVDDYDLSKDVYMT